MLKGRVIQIFSLVNCVIADNLIHTVVFYCLTRQFKCFFSRVQRFLEFNVDFLDVERPSDLMFDVTEFKTAKQVRVTIQCKPFYLKSTQM